MAKLLLGDDLQNPKLDEETAWQILSLLWSPISTVTHNLTQPSATNTQQELVTQVSASLVTTKPSDQGIPLPPPPRGFMLPTKRVLPARSTEHIVEALKEVMLELEPTAPTMKKYRSTCRNKTLMTMTWPQPESSMASAQNSTQDPQTSVAHHNHIVIRYQQPPDPAIVNYSRNTNRSYKNLFLKKSSSNTVYPRLYKPNNSIITDSL